jgi:transcriptional regulator with XRE-family HTH domain
MPRKTGPSTINGLRRLRALSGMSQREFARYLEVCHVNLNNWEWSRTYPRPDARRQLCKQLGLSPNQLIQLLTTYAGDYAPPARLAEKLSALNDSPPISENWGGKR